MSTEWIKQIAVRPDGVYLHSKSNNDDIPFHTWRCDSLTEVYQQEGQRGLDREMVIMLCEYARIVGHHPSMERYRPCLRQANALQEQCFAQIRQKHEGLTLEDTVSLYTEYETPAAQAYRQFERDARAACYEQLAQLAALLPEKKPKREERSL